MTDEQRKALDDLVNENVALMEEIMFERILFQNNLENEFSGRLMQKWWRGFAALESMYLMTIEYVNDYKDKYYKKHDKWESLSHTQFALKNIHGRACQVFSEIICLLKNGYADGSFARWRTLFELSVFAIFIRENGDDVALAFIQQSDDNLWEFQTGAEWAKDAACFKNDSSVVSFAKIFKSINFPSDTKTFWQKQYRFSCKVVHASPQGTLKRLANSGTEENIIPVGRSEWGLHSPAEHAAHSFLQVTTAFFSTFADVEVLFQAHVLRKWVDIICKHLYETVRECFPDVPNAKEIASKYFGEEQENDEDK